MPLKEQCLCFVRKYGSAAKLVATSVLNVVAPAPLASLVGQVFDKANQIAHDNWEQLQMELAKQNRDDLQRLGQVIELLGGDLARLCDKALAFQDQPDAVEDIVRRALVADRTLNPALERLALLVPQFACMQEQIRGLVDGNDEMLPIMRRVNRFLDFVEDCWAAQLPPRARASLLHVRQEVVHKIQHRDLAAVDAQLLELRRAVPQSASVCLLEAAVAVVEHDDVAVQQALGTAARLKPDDAEVVELHKRATVLATRATPRQRIPRPTTPNPTPTRLQPSELLDGWTLEARLGAGGWGQVFKAARGGETRALKVMHPEYACDRNFVERFKKEIAALLKLPRHDNLVRIDTNGFGYCTDRQTWYLVMEYIDGPTLEQYLASKGPFSEAQVRKLFTDAIAGLAQAHAAGIVHRDIKPGNLIFRKKDQRLVFVDFGLAVGVEDFGKTNVGGISVLFAAPEQHYRDPATQASDVFSLCAVLHYALNYDKVDLRKPNRFQPGNVPEALRAALTRGMQQNADLRFAHAGELLLALLPVAEVAQPVPKPTAPPKGETPVERVRRLKGEAARLHETARTLLQRHDYAEAAKLLESFRPELVPLREAVLYGDAVSNRDRLRQLHEQIHHRLNSGQLRDPKLPSLIAAYLSIKPDDADMAELAREFPNPKRGEVFTDALGMKFAFVPAGTFYMSANDRNAQRQVTIADDFWIGVYPVTQGEWQAVMGSNPSYFSRGGEGKDKVKSVSDADLRRFPVENVSWNNVAKDDDKVPSFLQKLNAQEKNRQSGFLYRLPTEAEWEYACRGGATSQADCSFDFYFAKPTNDLSPKQANFSESKLGRPCQVGLYSANPLGIHDLHGNVWEWCDDLYEDGSSRVVRGGGWNDDASRCRAAYRSWDAPSSRHYNLGFRLARSSVPE